VTSIDLWYATRATGIVALALLTTTTFLGVLTAGRARSDVPAFARADVHRRLAALTLAFLAIHIITAVVDSYVHIGWVGVVVPFASGYESLWIAIGAVSFDLFVAIALSSVLRRHISASAWRAVHWLAYLNWPTAVIHTLGMGTDTKLDWVLALVALMVASVVAVTAWRVVDGVRIRSQLPKTIATPRRSLRPTFEEGHR
jgi:DMSO/TMAO reductase YedYZ heme-binding membrane subunit